MSAREHQVGKVGRVSVSMARMLFPRSIQTQASSHVVCDSLAPPLRLMTVMALARWDVLVCHASSVSTGFEEGEVRSRGSGATGKVSCG